uniref:Uncharacterized protein n=1 Tax=Romanomermis culicivorax TaxID=13658 RepID=A0A915IM32_ROMCU
MYPKRRTVLTFITFDLCKQTNIPDFLVEMAFGYGEFDECSHARQKTILSATCAYSVPVSSDNYNHQENVEKTATVEEELEKGREACNKDFIETEPAPEEKHLQSIKDSLKMISL